MKIEYKNPVELEKLIPADLAALYELGDLKDMEAELEANGWLVPGTLSKDGIPLDCYRRIKVAIKLGWIEVPVYISDLEATAENRVALNQGREKTWKDKRTDLVVSFETFGLKQGQRDSVVKYNRYDEIRKRNGCHIKDDKTIREVEWILKNDLNSMVMAWWMIEKAATVSSVKRILEFRNECKYTSIINEVFEKKLSPGAALKQIKVLEAGEQLGKKAFKLPENNSESIIIHEGDHEEILLQLELGSVKALFYEPERFVLSAGDSVNVYAMKIITDVKPFLENRLYGFASIFITVREVYTNGVALKLPSKVIEVIEKETGLTYKQTIYNTSSELTTDKKVGNQLPDTVSHILWFVKFDKSKINSNLFNIKMPLDVEDNAALIYRQCSNHINNQILSDMIVNINDKEIIASASALIPLYLSTQENDLVVDLSMKGDVAPAAAIMNRKYLGVSPNRKLYDKSVKSVSSVIKSYKAEMTKRLFGTPYEIVPNKKVGTKVSSKTVKN
jgi:hypothetical protein